MNSYDPFDFNMLLLSPFDNTAQTPTWKKTSNNYFDGLIMPFDQVMAGFFPSSNNTGLFPFSNDNRTGSSDRMSMMSLLVDKVRAETEMLKMKIMSVRQKNDEVYDVKLKCLDIAFRLSSGENVSTEDLRFLEENDRELYVQAMLDKMQSLRAF